MKQPLAGLAADTRVRIEALRAACETAPRLSNGTPAESIVARAEIFRQWLSRDPPGSDSNPSGPGAEEIDPPRPTG